MVQYLQIKKHNTSHKQRIDKNHMIRSTDVENAFDKVQHTFDRNTQQSGNRGIIPQHNKSHIGETYSQHHNQWEKMKGFTTKIRNKTRMSTLTTSIQHSI